MNKYGFFVHSEGFGHCNDKAYVPDSSTCADGGIIWSWASLNSPGTPIFLPEEERQNARVY